MSKSLLDGVLGSYGVRDDEGNFDVELTVAKFAKEFTVFAEMQAKDNELIAEEITNTVIPMYDANPKAALNTQGIVSLVASKIGFSADTYVPLKARIEAALKADNHFWTNRGPGAGLHYMPEGSEDYTQFQVDGMNPGERLSKKNDEIKAMKKALRAAKSS